MWSGNRRVGKSRKQRRGRSLESAGTPLDYGPLARWVGFNLRLAQEASFQAFSRRSKQVGESPGRFATLTIIARNPGISQTALSRASGRDKSSITPVIEDLVRRGLVARKHMRSDRRAWRLTLTAAGKRALATLIRCARAHDRKLDNLIGRRDRARFLTILKRIAAEME